MAEIRDVAAYFCARYPHKQELSKARLTKMVYLADWKSALLFERQMTSIEWFYNEFGPYVSDVVDSIRDDKDFAILSTINTYGSKKDLIEFNGLEAWPSLAEADKEVLDFVIDRTAPQSWAAFIRLVYSTHPVMTEPKHSHLNLVEHAREYQATRTSQLVDAT